MLMSPRSAGGLSVCFRFVCGSSTASAVAFSWSCCSCSRSGAYVRALSLSRLRTNLAWILIDPATTLVTSSVRVPTISVQTTGAFAIVSQEPRIGTGSFLAIIRFVAKAKVRVRARVRATASGRPSGMATVTSVTEMVGIWVKVSRRPSGTATETSVTDVMSIWVKAMPFSLGVL